MKKLMMGDNRRESIVEKIAAGIRSEMTVEKFINTYKSTKRQK